LSEFHYKKTENRYNSWCKICVYDHQKLRWKDRKRKAVELLGGKCCQCGYNKNLSALDFHHINPEEKEYDFGKLREKRWEDIIKELQKCVLLCSNCHREVHTPDENMISSNTDNNVLNYESTKWLNPTGECPNCKQDVYGTKYCSVKCAKLGNRKVKNRPSKEILLKQIEEMGYCAVGRLYGVSDIAVRKWVNVTVTPQFPKLLKE
jgi:hypothetical protein